MTPPLRGLIVGSPWIEQIVSGRKVWELRPQRTHIRGAIALIRAHSGRIVATARLVDCIGPMSYRQLLRHRARHRVPADQLRRWVSRFNGKAWAWVLSDVRPLVPPVPYRRKRGQQTWVKLAEDPLSQRAAA